MHKIQLQHQKCVHAFIPILDVPSIVPPSLPFIFFGYGRKGEEDGRFKIEAGNKIGISGIGREIF
jgi:hypothetical protein